MNKKLIISGLLLSLCSGCFSQMFVIDMQAIASSIQNGITMGQQLSTAYNQLKTTYEQVQNQIKNMQSMDLSSVGTSLLNNLQKNADSYISLSENLEEAYKSKNLKVGNISFSLEDICTTNVYDVIKEDYGELKEFGSLTEDQKRSFLKKYGIEYDRFIKLYAISQEIGEKSMEIKAKNDKVNDTVKNLISVAQNVADNVTGETSQTAMLQKNALLASQNLTALSQTLDQVSNISDIIASQYQEEMNRQNEELQARMEMKEMTQSSPEYMKNSVGDESNYYGMGNAK